MAKTTFKGLLRDTIEQVEASKVPIRAVEYDPSTKKLRVEFDRPEAPPALPAPISLPGAVQAPLAERIQAVDTKYIPGTRIPDDNSPVDAMEIAEARPRYGLDPEPRSPEPNGVA